MCRRLHKCSFSLCVDWHALWRESSVCSMTSLCFCKRLAVRREAFGTGPLREPSPSRRTTYSELDMPFATDLCFNKIRFICLFIYLFVFFISNFRNKKSSLPFMSGQNNRLVRKSKANDYSVCVFVALNPTINGNVSGKRHIHVRAFLF